MTASQPPVRPVHRSAFPSTAVVLRAPGPLTPPSFLHKHANRREQLLVVGLGSVLFCLLRMSFAAVRSRFTGHRLGPTVRGRAVHSPRIGRSGGRPSDPPSFPRGAFYCRGVGGWKSRRRDGL